MRAIHGKQGALLAALDAAFALSAFGTERASATDAGVFAVALLKEGFSLTNDGWVANELVPANAAQLAQNVAR